MPRLPEESNLADSTPPSANAIVSAAGKKMPVLVSPVVVMAADAADPAGNIPTPETVKVVASRLVMVAEDEVRVVIFAEAILRLERTRLVAVRLVMLADAALRSVNDASAQVRLAGFVPSSTT
jgi:hypothetical protein